MELKIDDATYWKDCINAIHSILDEGEFNISENGISLKSINNTGISMVSFFIPNKAFSKYEIDKPKSIGINIDSLSKVLNNKRDEQLIIKDNNNKISFELISQNAKRKYKLPMIDVRKDGNKEPNVNFESYIEIKSDLLKATLKDASLISAGNILFKIDKNEFRITANTDFVELEEVIIDNADFKIQSNKATSVAFSLEYLMKIVSACPPDSDIKLSLKTKEPIKLDYAIRDAKFVYYLAPYVIDE